MPFLSHNDLRITHRRIPLTRLPQAFVGLRLLQISDLHFYERTEPAYYRRVAAHIQKLAPDLVVLTGDVVHYGPNFVEQAGQFLRQLHAPLGKLAIMGNHDYHDGAWGQNIMSMLAKAGFDLLVNSNRVFEKDGERLWIAGLDDLWYGHPNIEDALRGIPNQTDTTIVLAHNPLLFDPVALSGLGQVDLVISGHTHAGHVYIPFLGPIYRRIFRMKYRYGLFEKNGCQLHVTSGVGSAAFYLKKQRIGFPRFRWNTTPEIALLELCHANESRTNTYQQSVSSAIQ